MLKLGIYKKEQLGTARLEGFFGRRKFIAQDLYNQLQEYSPKERAYYQGKIINNLSVGNGTFKTTSSNRFNDFDKQALKIIQNNFPANSGLKLHDIGISDDRTSCDLFSQLNNIYGQRLDFLASDYAPYFFVVRKEGSARRILLDGKNKIIQVVFPPFVFSCTRPERKLFYPLNFIVRKITYIFYAVPLLKTYLKGMSNNIEVKKIALLCDDFTTLVKENQNIHFEQQNIFNKPKTQFNIIRIMNLLNKSYFSERLLQKAVRNVLSSLIGEGLFIVGSNKEQGTTVDGGIYKKTKGIMKCIYKSGQGSIVEPMIF